MIFQTNESFLRIQNTFCFWAICPIVQSISHQLFNMHWQEKISDTKSHVDVSSLLLTRFAAVHREAGFLAHVGLAETWASTGHFAGIRSSPGHGVKGAGTCRPDCGIHHQCGGLTGIGYIHKPGTWRGSNLMHTSKKNLQCTSKIALDWGVDSDWLWWNPDKNCRTS